MTEQRPLNILWISYEDTSPRFPCYGDHTVATPHLDRLVHGGCVYEHCYASTGVCAPSRASVITGCWPTWLGAHHMRTSHTVLETPELPTPYECTPPPDVQCLGDYFRRAGYWCSNNVKTDYQFAPPSSAWDDCSRQAHWRGREAGQPFFAVWNFDESHESCMWDGPPPSWHRPFPEDLERVDPATVPMPPEVPDTPECRAALARHYDRIAHNDRRLGELLDQLEADGEAEHTLVMLWSDHGSGLPRHKRWPYDGGIHVPLIVRWPGVVAPGTRASRLVAQVDFAPTMLAAAGLTVPPHMQGAPFCGPAEQPRSHVFATRDRYDSTYDHVRAVRDGRYKLIRNLRPDLPYLGWLPYRNRHPMMRELWRRLATESLEPGQEWVAATQRPAVELYDCEADPHELDNRADDPALAGVRAELETALDGWCERYDRWGGVAESEMLRQWWPDGVQPQTGRVLAIALGTEADGQEALADGAELRGAHVLQFHCPTQGASIEYRLGDGPWRVYGGPLRLPAGETRIAARGCRIGYRPGETCTWRVQLTG